MLLVKGPGHLTLHSSVGLASWAGEAQRLSRLAVASLALPAHVETMMLRRPARSQYSMRLRLLTGNLAESFRQLLPCHHMSWHPMHLVTCMNTQQQIYMYSMTSQITAQEPWHRVGLHRGMQQGASPPDLGSKRWCSTP